MGSRRRSREGSPLGEAIGRASGRGRASKKSWSRRSQLCGDNPIGKGYDQCRERTIEWAIGTLQTSCGCRKSGFLTRRGAFTDEMGSPRGIVLNTEILPLRLVIESIRRETGRRARIGFFPDLKLSSQ